MANDDGIVRIGTQVDVSGLRSGMQEAASSVQASAGSMSAALESARLASHNLAQAQEEFGAAAASGSEQAAAVLQMYRAELASAQSAVQAFSGAESAETAVLRESISARMAATAELRAVSGSISGADRAAGLFLGTLPGVGEALSVAFPVFGVAALLQIMTEAGEGIAHLIEGAQELATELNTNWLQGAFGQLSGLADATKQVDDEMSQLAADMDRVFAERRGEQISEIARTQGPAAGDIASATDAFRELQANQQMLATLEIDRLQLQQKVAQEKAASEPMDYSAASIAARDAELKATKDLQVVEAQIADYRERDINLIQRANDLQSQAADQKNWKSPLAREQEQAAKEFQRQNEEMSRQTTELINKQTNEEIKSYEKLEKLKERVYGSEHFSAEDTGQLQMDDVLKKAEEDYEKLGQAQVDAYDIQQKNADSLAEATLRAQEALHAISPLAAAEAQAALHAKEYEQALAALNAQLQVQQQLGKQVEAAQTQNQITQLNGNRSVQQIQDQTNVQQQISQPWLNAFQQINQGWLEVQNKMLFTTRNIGLEFAKMGQNLVIWGLDSAEKWALQWIEKELLTVVFHQTANAQKTASDIAANAAALTGGLTTNTALAQSYAAVAAAGAAASVAAIPVVGWAMAPGVAASTYAEVGAMAAMASFDIGTGYVPRDGIAMLHQGEAVIPAPTVQELRGGGGNGDVNITQHNTWNTMTDREFKRHIRRHASDVAGAVRQHLRQKGQL